MESVRVKTMNEYVRATFYVIMILLFSLIAYGVLRLNLYTPLKPQMIPILIPGTEKDAPLKPYIKPNNIDNEYIDELIVELNQYRTNYGLIKIKPFTITASLYNREWSIDYVMPKTKNEVGLIIGTYLGLYYQYNVITDFNIGLQMTFKRDSADLGLMIGYQF